MLSSQIILILIPPSQNVPRTTFLFSAELPKGEDQNEWLAVNSMFHFYYATLFIHISLHSTKQFMAFPPSLCSPFSVVFPIAVDFFNEISLLYGTISDYCTRDTCPRMTAGDDYEYLWMDGVKYKKPTEVAAPEYVELLMAWVEAQINDEQIFPLQLGTPFPKDFVPRIRKIYQRLFRVYAHVYLSHIDRIVDLGAGAHLNTCFKHFIFFVKEFKLIEEAELEPLKHHIEQLTKPTQEAAAQ